MVQSVAVSRLIVGTVFSFALIAGCASDTATTDLAVENSDIATALQTEPEQKPEIPKLPTLPKADIFEMVAMRDGVRLETHILLPETEGPAPAILTRTPYRDGVSAWGMNGHQRYLDAGYAVVWQNTRGVGASEGTFHFMANERSDGYDTVEWIADQSWSDGNVGMDGGSYLGMTQFAAAAAQPPSLKAIAPRVPTVDLFREIPRQGGIIVRHHLLSWFKLVSVEHRSELDASFVNPSFVIEDPVWRERLMRRPLVAAADGYLEGDRLEEWRRIVRADDRSDELWRSREKGPEEYAKIDIPVLLISGRFDPAVGALSAWKNLEKYAPPSSDRYMIIGPWTHRQSLFGDVSENGPYSWGEADDVDVQGLRIAFFDRYLKNQTPDVAFPDRVQVFVTGSNEWRQLQSLPMPDGNITKLHLSSSGNANSNKGDGALSASAASDVVSDTFVSDPENPINAKTEMGSGISYYQDVEDRDDVLVYTTPPLEKSTTILGEPTLNLSVSSDTKDADIIVRLTEVFPDGSSVGMGFGGALRLRFRDGYDQPKLLEPGETYDVKIPLGFVAHTVPAGHRIRINLSGTEYPLFDPNPNTGEDIATAIELQTANVSIHQGGEHNSWLELPVSE